MHLMEIAPPLVLAASVLIDSWVKCWDKGRITRFGCIIFIVIIGATRADCQLGANARTEANRLQELSVSQDEIEFDLRLWRATVDTEVSVFRELVAYYTAGIAGAATAATLERDSKAPRWTVGVFLGHLQVSKELLNTAWEDLVQTLSKHDVPSNSPHVIAARNTLNEFEPDAALKAREVVQTAIMSELFAVNRVCA